MIEQRSVDFPAQQRTGTGRVQMSAAQIRRVRRNVLLDMCRFMLLENSTHPSVDNNLAGKLLQREPFRRWLRQSHCLEIYNRMYIKNPHISSLYKKLNDFLSSTISALVEHIYKTTDIRPIVFKGIEILGKYAPHPIGSTSDIDLVVLQPSFRRACEALAKLGWIQGAYRGELGIIPYDATIIRKTEEGHYETAPFVKIFEMNLSDAELDCIGYFPNGAFFNFVETKGQAIKFLFYVDMHWGFLSHLDPTQFRLENSIFPFAVTVDDSDHLYLMLLRNYYEAVKQTGKLKNLVVSILLLERGRIDSDRIYDQAIRDGRQTAIAANIPLLEKISPHLSRLVDPRGRFAECMPDTAAIEMFQDSLLGLKKSH
jgi:hypothetical protein